MSISSVRCGGACWRRRSSLPGARYEVFFSRDQLWIAITGIAVAYCVWNFFLRYPKDTRWPAGYHRRRDTRRLVKAVSLLRQT